MKLTSRHSLLLCLAIVFAATFICLGTSYFNTKGEPREALVPQAMLRTGNWILPERYGDVVATKPPMTHWLMALFSLANNGNVTETTSRLPSACASLAIVAAFFLFLRKRSSTQVAFLSCLLLASTIDFHRSAMTARVDMVLSCFLFIGLLMLYQWHEKGMKGMPLVASLLLGCAALTKGPVGIVLPCFVFFVYALIARTPFWSLVVAMFKIALPASLLPLLWYVAAYIQGGDAFLQVVLEENVGRFTGKMSYESHNNPFFYPYLYSFIGCMPWTLLLLLVLPTLRWKGWRMETFYQKLRNLDPLSLFCLVGALCILVFYSIPSSKRAVYQLPAYPFFAYFLAKFMLSLQTSRPKVLISFGYLLGGITVLATLILLSLPHITLPKEDLIVTALQNLPTDAIALLAMLLTLAALITIFILLHKHSSHLIAGCVFLFYALQFMLDASILPAIKNAESIKPFVQEINRCYPDTQHYGYQAQFWQLNFYLDHKLKEFSPSELGQEGTLFLRESDVEAFQSAHPEYQLKKLARTPHRKTDVRDYICLYHLQKRH